MQARLALFLDLAGFKYLFNYKEGLWPDLARPGAVPVAIKLLRL